MTRTLITGANKGLGYETARRLLDAGHEVWMAARDPQRGGAAAEELGGRFLELDVTDEDSVAAAVELVAGAGGLDVLVNNAGIAGARVAVPETSAEDLRTVFETNVFGAVRVLQAFTPLLDAAPVPVVVNVSSGLGSLGLASDPDGPYRAFVMLAYPASKAALNMLTVKWAQAHPRWRVNAADPGYTATDLNAHRGLQTVSEGTDAIVALACLGADGPTGTFVDRNGPVPW
ncbi:MAG TPA: SDR family NAD(P)-dependent oxidoreductase [Solirubrobacteraceae bacterium]|jgi:NAD(P)-dependent dehydrogenase (short-subunit alcohol dehydrogenase family)|nr:SDR family NAD(P)-dependent oxidoreductase [Solirubrobacteraceae bacterium]